MNSIETPDWIGSKAHTEHLDYMDQFFIIYAYKCAGFLITLVCF